MNAQTTDDEDDNNSHDEYHALDHLGFDVSIEQVMEDLASFGSPSHSSIAAPPPPMSPGVDSPTTLNAVHMEIQENDKIPTFYQPVNRKGSSSTKMMEDFRLNDSDIAEYFLKEDVRHGMQLSYKSSDPLDELVNPSVTLEKGKPIYARTKPLPIPTKNSSLSPKADADPVATAAALAAVEKTTAPPASMLEASAKRNQYGFGMKHKVPAVPKPPQHKKTAIFSNETMSESIGAKRKDMSASVASSTSGLDNTNGGGDAYERKKLRAKEARIKLKDAIDRLAIAINLAGTQTRQRMELLPENSDILQETIDTADGAKKWDRPSFVGSAAALIQSLNAQCELLARDLAELRHQQRGEHRVEAKRPRLEAVSLSVVSDVDMGYSTTPHPSGDTAFDENSILSDDSKLRDSVARFMDPITLIRCSMLNKNWRTTACTEDLWNDMAQKRFGTYNVRQWVERLDDTDDMKRLSFLSLYRSMDKANLMPHWNHVSKVVFLGSIRLPGKISAWTYIVERSNGETHRSVEVPPDSSKKGGYVSLPVVELRTVVQNTGISEGPIYVSTQKQTVDASTRRRGEEMVEIDWDTRFRKFVTTLDGMPLEYESKKDLCNMKLFDAVVIGSFFHARGCSTTSKFIQRANFTRLLVTLNSGVTVPLVIPFPRDGHAHP